MTDAMIASASLYRLLAVFLCAETEQKTFFSSFFLSPRNL